MKVGEEPQKSVSCDGRQRESRSLAVEESSTLLPRLRCRRLRRLRQRESAMSREDREDVCFRLCLSEQEAGRRHSVHGPFRCYPVKMFGEAEAGMWNCLREPLRPHDSPRPPRRWRLLNPTWKDQMAERRPDVETRLSDFPLSG